MELNNVVYCLRYCSVYIDNLLMSLKKNDIGCHVGSHCCGPFGYADDIKCKRPTKYVRLLQRVCIYL